jgi:hypothetical protein
VAGIIAASVQEITCNEVRTRALKPLITLKTGWKVRKCSLRMSFPMTPSYCMKFLITPIAGESMVTIQKLAFKAAVV